MICKNGVVEAVARRHIGLVDIIYYTGEVWWDVIEKVLMVWNIVLVKKKIQNIKSSLCCGDVSHVTPYHAWSL